MRKRISLLFLTAVCLLFFSQGLSAVEDEERWIVKFDDSVALSNQMISLVDGEWEQVGKRNRGIYVVDEELAQDLADSPYVDYIEEDAYVYLDAVPDDPYYTGEDNDQWALKNLNAEAGWDIATGSAAVTVAVIDSGFYYAHEDNSAGNIRAGLNYLNYPMTVQDTTTDNQHGSMVAGIIGATTDNGIGIAGGAWDCDIVMMHTMGSSGYCPVSYIAAAIFDAIGIYGADVINISAGTIDALTLTEAIQYADQQGVIVVASAGNNGDTTYNYPAAYDEVISVGSVDKNNKISWFSQRNDKVTVVAPGQSVVSLTNSANGYAFGSGTSFAAPYVTALAALALSLDPDLTADEFRVLLIETSTDLGVAGYDTSYGWGLADYGALLTELVGTEGTVDTPYGTLTVEDTAGHVLIDETKMSAILTAEGDMEIDVSDTNARDFDIELPSAVLDLFVEKESSLTVVTRFGTISLPAGLLLQAKTELALPAEESYVLRWGKESISFFLTAPSSIFTTGISVSFGGGGLTLEKYDVPAAITLFGKNQSFTTAVRVLEGGSILPLPTKRESGNGTVFIAAPGTFALASRTLSFTDISGHWAEDVITDMAGRFIVNGVSDTLFRPSQAVTRAEFAALLVRALGLGENGSGSAFSDVNSAAWYYGAVYTAYENDLIHGMGNGKFCPNQSVTREQAMVMIANSLGILGMETELNRTPAAILSVFADYTQCSAWAMEASALLVQDGLIQGSGQNLNPLQVLTRAEAVKMLNNLLVEANLIE